MRTVLNCTCGTGQHLLMLSEMGFQVFGSDYSASMLTVAAKNLQAHGKQVPLHQCDFRYLQNAYTDTFDAVLCLTTALPHYTQRPIYTVLQYKLAKTPNKLLPLYLKTHYKLL